jgi:putative glycosyltransferase (TIGR04348 family)
VKVLIVTPESTSLPVGNSVTATRWAGILQTLGYQVEIANAWTVEDCGLLIALHACRSEASIELFRRAHPQRPLILALTGTDLYRDLRNSGAGHRSLALATHIVVLQEAALEELDHAARAKTNIIYQSAVAPAHRDPPSEDYFDVCVLSHLRLLKDPLRTAYAVSLMPAESRMRVTHAGRALESQWEEKAKEEQTVNSRYRWIGEQSHDAAMRLLTACRLLVVSSTMEGGANAIAESVVCGVPALCSDVPGNIGMLGSDYPGYFRLRDTTHLAELLKRAELDADFLPTLQEFIGKIQHRFAPAQELASWKSLLDRI